MASCLLATLGIQFMEIRCVPRRLITLSWSCPLNEANHLHSTAILNGNNDRHSKFILFKLSCCRRLLKDPWTAKRSNQSIPKEISPEYSLQGLMLKLKLQSFGHLMQRGDSLEKTLMLGKIEGRRRRGRQRMSLLDNITEFGPEFEQAAGVGEGQGSLACYSP